MVVGGGRGSKQVELGVAPLVYTACVQHNPLQPALFWLAKTGLISPWCVMIVTCKVILSGAGFLVREDLSTLCQLSAVQ